MTTGWLEMLSSESLIEGARNTPALSALTWRRPALQGLQRRLHETVAGGVFVETTRIIDMAIEEMRRQSESRYQAFRIGSL